ncbi:hypothetical protein AK812_SmicGene16453 [Symbiodinium microadriaticum]|uniref:Uncharacterized protein n=1 Tax=Symbiodinium microadriaticum TaxID=2951 RepID=A0A1Q9E0B8_SYMMI|nr:hypothetical protein AK812_SmicGene16453 [Symbiodinium microadriaticum]
MGTTADAVICCAKQLLLCLSASLFLATMTTSSEPGGKNGDGHAKLVNKYTLTCYWYDDSRHGHDHNFPARLAKAEENNQEHHRVEKSGKCGYMMKLMQMAPVSRMESGLTLSWLAENGQGLGGPRFRVSGMVLASLARQATGQWQKQIRMLKKRSLVRPTSTSSLLILN